MVRTRLQLTSDRRVAATRATLARDLRNLAEDAGVTQRAIAAMSGVPQPYISRIFAGTESPTLETYARLAAALGADFAARVHPNTGPLIRDRFQAPMLEALLAAAGPRWQAYTELAVRRPGRGWIDAALHDQTARIIVATELQSDLRRLEQLVRWAAEKAASLPSWDGWSRLGEEPTVSQLLVVRRTRATVATATEFARQLRVAYPAHPADALAALAGDAPWPGAALVWARVDGSRVRMSDT